MAIPENLFDPVEGIYGWAYFLTSQFFYGDYNGYRLGQDKFEEYKVKHTENVRKYNEYLPKRPRV